MAASNIRKKRKPSTGWRLYVHGRMVFGATTLEALARCTAIESKRRQYESGPECPVITVNSIEEIEAIFGPLKD